MTTPEKLTPDMKFAVLYADGTDKQVDEGVLFEFEDNDIILHLGTNRVACIFSIAEALSEFISDAGLGEAFKAYLEMCVPEDETDETV